jgi:hypothetical protein
MTYKILSRLTFGHLKTHLQTPKSGNFIFNTEVIDLSQKINISSYIDIVSDGTTTTQMSTSNDGTTFTPWTQISAILTRYKPTFCMTTVMPLTIENPVSGNIIPLL